MKNYEELQKLVSEFDKISLYQTICKNIKYYRLQKYNEFKVNNKNNLINPYSTENISALLDYNHNHYKRFESETDSIKRIPLEKIMLLSIILEKDIELFFIKNIN